MSAINWSRSGESVRAHRSPLGSDTLNRALKQILAESGYDLGSDIEDAFSGLLGPVFNVRANGVTGTSLNEVSDEIQEFLDEANAAGGGIVYLPDGNYYAKALVGYAGVHLIGQSWRHTKLIDVDGSSYVYSVNPGSGGTADPDDNATGIVIANLTVQGLVDTLGFSEHKHLINIHAVSDVLIDNVKVIGPRGDGVYIGSSNDGDLERHNERVTIRKCHFDGLNKDNRNAISIIDGTDILIDDVYITRFSRSNMPGAIDIEPNNDAYARCQNITIRKVRCHDIGGSVGAVSVFLPASQATLTTAASHVVIDDVVVTGCSAYGLIVQQVQTVADDTPENDITVSNYNASDCNRPFGFLGVKGVTLRDSVFSDCANRAFVGFTGATQNVRDVTITDTVFTRCGTSEGIAVGVYDAHGLTMRDVRFVDCGASSGLIGNAILFAAGTSSRVTLDTITVEDTGVARMTVAIQMSGHTFTKTTNTMTNVQLVGCSGNKFQVAHPVPITAYGAAVSLANNGPRIQDALTQAPNCGGVVTVPPGLWTCTTGFAITTDDTHLLGAGPNLSQIVMGANAINVCVVSGAIQRASVKGLWIGSFSARASGYGLRVTGTSGTHSRDVEIEKVKIQNCPSGFYAEDTDGLLTRDLEIVASIASACPGDAFKMTDVLGSHHFGLVVHGQGENFGGDGISVDSDCDSPQFFGCLSEFCTGVAWRFENSLGGSTGPRLVKLNSCSAESSLAGFVVNACRGLDAVAPHTAQNDQSGWVVSGGDAITISGGMSFSNGQHGIVLTGGNGSIVGHQAINNSQDTTETYDGIHVTAGAEHWTIGFIQGRSHILSTPPEQRTAVTVESGCDYIFLYAIDGDVTNAAPGANSAAYL